MFETETVAPFLVSKIEVWGCGPRALRSGYAPDTWINLQEHYLIKMSLDKLETLSSYSEFRID